MRKWSVLSALLFFSAAPVQANQITLLSFPSMEKPIVFGNIDVAYNYLSQRNHFTSGVYNRLNDRSLNGIALQQINVTFASLPTQGFGGLINALIGQDANGLAPSGFDPNVFAIQNVGGTIPQAYLQYAIQGTIFQFGEQLSLAGFEQIDYVENPQFSRSILNGYAEAGTHLGIRITQHISDSVDAIIGINNGWSTIRSPGRLRSFEGGFVYTYSPAFSLSINGYSGPEYVSSDQALGVESQRNAIDVFATWYLTPTLSFAINGDYVVQPKAALPYDKIDRAVWHGLAGYVTYIWHDKWLTAMRIEQFNDTNGYSTGVPQNWREITLTLAYSPWKNTQLRFETRHDISNVNAYVNKNNGSTSNHIQAFSFDVLYAL